MFRNTPFPDENAENSRNSASPSPLLATSRSRFTFSAVIGTNILLQNTFLTTADIIQLINNHFDDSTENISSPERGEDTISRLALEALINQLYGLPVDIPPFLILNELRVPFIPFDQVGSMISNGEIEKYTLESIVQPWSRSPKENNKNRIITLYGKNGLTYLVRAQYNQVTKQIFPPSSR